MEGGGLGLVIIRFTNMTKKTLLVEGKIECPNCGRVLIKGDVMFEDTYRKEFFCGYCEEEYQEAVMQEEGEDGRLLK